MRAGLGLLSIAGLTLSLTACSAGKPNPQAAEARQMAHQQKQAELSAETTYSQQLDQIAPPSKTLYLTIRTQGAWQNPVLVIEPSSVRLRYQGQPNDKATSLDASGANTATPNKTPALEPAQMQSRSLRRATTFKHEPLRRQQRTPETEPRQAQASVPIWQKLSLGALPQTLATLPRSTWPYGRVITVEDAPAKSWRDRAQIRRNEETALKVLDDMGIVAYEWPSHNTGF